MASVQLDHEGSYLPVRRNSYSEMVAAVCLLLIGIGILLKQHSLLQPKIKNVITGVFVGIGSAGLLFTVIFEIKRCYRDEEGVEVESINIPKPVAAKQNDFSRISTLGALKEQLEEKGIILGFKEDLRRRKVSAPLFEGLKPGRYFVYYSSSPRILQGFRASNRQAYNALYPKKSDTSNRPIILISMHKAETIHEMSQSITEAEPSKWGEAEPPADFVQIHEYSENFPFQLDQNKWYERQLEKVEKIHAKHATLEKKRGE